MSCKRCASEEQKDFNGELAIHFPGMDGLDKPIVWVFPKLLVCLCCGFGEFVVPDEQASVATQIRPMMATSKPANEN
jgi:hypothetical protein